MEGHQQYDPRIKQQIKNDLFTLLYTPVEQNFKRQLDSIIIKNSVLMRSAYYGFNHRGILYSLLAGPIPRQIVRLNPTLYPLMDEYLESVNQLNKTELPYVLGFINRVLNSSNDLRDFLTMLPASVHRPIEKLIAIYPCEALSVGPDVLQNIIKENQIPINMIKRRLLSNLLI